MVNQLIPGVAVGVSRYGRHIVDVPLGWADIENDVPVRRYSMWRMASISKSLTSALVGKLMENGRLSLNESIYKYLKPGIFPVKQWKGKDVDITVGQLMSHTSGLPVDNSDKDMTKIYEYTNCTESVAKFRNDPLISAPGTQYNYSNYAYQVLGAVIESVTNENFATTIDKLMRDIHMNATMAETYGMVVRHRVHDYIRSDSGYLLHPTTNKSQLHLMNAVILDDSLTVEAQWSSGDSYYNINNTNPDLLKSETINQLWEPIFKKTIDKFGTHKTAHGWEVIELDKPITCTNKCQMPASIRKVIWKTGGLYGLATIIVILPEQHICVTFFCNNSSFNNTGLIELALIVAKQFMM
ncbi:serine beta-lactamase-like protein LACTB, mitochondrial isoform X2 [Oppia nitens]|uniref:serine beta-lactamase-like protein LACTB, mitochondrial isoform X2 n=1 Tax=Oppia nitens TaxID=1686743 RepID=UPI0023DBBC6A|nr:serine beta-lactamase-like protein LACTB, mitochondrial isoform X2 [Oppia nitens]